MKNYLKSQIKNLPMIIIVSIIFCGINTLATNYLFKAKEVEFDNTNTSIESTNVGDAIDELYTAANNFATYDTRLQGIETKIGSDTLNTTSSTLIGGINEVNNSITYNSTTILASVATHTYAGIKIMKSGNNKIIKISGFVDIDANTYTTICTLPDEYKSIEDFTYDVTALLLGSTPRKLRFDFDSSNKQVKVYNYGSAFTDNNMQITIPYL